MGFARGKFGVEYHPRNNSETPRLRGLVCVVLALVAVAFAWYKIAGQRAAPEAPAPNALRAEPSVAVPPPRPALAQQTAAVPPPAPPKKAAAARPDAPPPRPALAPDVARLAARLEETLEQRTTQDQVLISRYLAAERQGNPDIAGDTLRRLHDRPTLADLRDPLLRRLGDLNLLRLFSGKESPWTTTVTVRRGDGRDRIAREYRNTPAAVAKLNPLVKWERLRPGDAVRVLRFPSAVLVIHKQLDCADLTLRKEDRFFRRYDLTVSPSARAAVYDISPEAHTTVGARFRELGVKIAPDARRELEMFLAPGSRITVTE